MKARFRLSANTRNGSLVKWAPLLFLSFAQAVPLGGQQASRDLFVTAGKSLVVDSPVVIQRVAVADPDLAEAVAVTPREVLINGRAPGETSLIIWQQGGNRLMFDLNVRPNEASLESVRREIAKEFPGEDIQVTVENKNVFLRGTVKDLISAQRAESMASTLGKVINLLQVEVPPVDTQVLLKVRFANVDRAASRELGANFVSTGGINRTPGRITTGQFNPPRAEEVSSDATFTLTDALNLFLFRPDLDIGATIRALQNKRMLEILAEPNVLAIDGKPASFLAGGEFPFPVVQGGANAGAVTIQFREFGVRLNFLPRVTPRGTIRLQVTPEVSSLDFANGLLFQGFTIPAISTRRVQTEIELESQQSFAIAGLLDNRMVEIYSKIPGIGDIPILGKLFQSQSKSKNNNELLVVVTPEIVRPIPAGQPLPQVNMPPMLFEWGSTTAPRTPGAEVTGPVAEPVVRKTVPVEKMIEMNKPQTGPATAPAFAPSPAIPNPPPAQPAATQAAATQGSN